MPPAKTPAAKPVADAASPKPTAAAAPTAPAPAAATGTASGAAAKPKPINVTLSTHASEAAAEEGWKSLVAKHGAVLSKRTPLVLPIEGDDERGRAYRLATGPFASAREAAEFCDKLLARRAYCVISG